MPGVEQFPILTILVALPLLGAIALMFFPNEEKNLARHFALTVTGVTFLASLYLLSYSGLPSAFAATPLKAAFPTMEFVESYEWIPALGVRYLVGLDGISLWLVMLTTFLGPIVVLSTYEAIDKRVKEFMICFLLLMTGMLGALVALDAFLFYVFWELMLVPMYFMIGIWGGPRRYYATIKFFLYTVVGSLLMLIAILYIYFQGASDGAMSFSLADMMKVQLGETEQLWLFAAFALAFAIKVPLFPFHTWLPDAHVQAPTAGSVILAGVLLKMGTYGMIRYGFPLFPEAVVTFAPWLALLASIGIIYGALVAMVQKDVKKLVAYSSVSHLGFCVLGLVALTATAVEGSIYVMLAHGIATGGLFLAVGVIYERRHTRLISEFGGLTKVVPLFAVFFMIIVFTSAGLPGLAGFIGEFLVIMGTGQSTVLHFGEAAFLVDAGLGPERWAFIFAAMAATGMIFGAVYLLWMFQRVMFGPLTNPKNEHMKDLNGREIAYFVPLILMAFLMGFFPEVFMSKMHTSVDVFMQRMRPAIAAKSSPEFEAERNRKSTLNLGALEDEQRKRLLERLQRVKAKGPVKPSANQGAAPDTKPAAKPAPKPSPGETPKSPREAVKAGERPKFQLTPDGQRALQKIKLRQGLGGPGKGQKGADGAKP